MSDATSLLSPAALEHALRQRFPDWADVQWLAATESTNTDLLAQARAGLPLPRLRGTHMQVSGRGRANRNFQTAAGDALMFSCAFETTLPIAALPTMSVAFGLVACETLARRLPAGHQLRLKWPNDLQWGEAKLAGILMESASTGYGGKARVVIGMGLNLRGAQALSAQLGRQVADWQVTGCSDSAADLCAAVAAAWQQALVHAEQTWVPGLGLPDLAVRYTLHDALAGQAVNVQDQGKILMQGMAAGVAADGRLQLDTERGVQTVTVGDVSVRPHASHINATQAS